MNKLLIVIALVLFSITTASAQITLSGSVKNTSGEPQPFANVTLYLQSDSTKIVNGSITDFSGNYAIQNVKIGDYRIVVSAIGIATTAQDVSVKDTAKIVKDFVVEESVSELDEVVVKDYRKHRYTDHTEYTFTRQQIDNALDAKDLIKNVNGIKIDPTSNALVSNRKGDVKILINGISASDIDLKALQTNQIAKVEYYNIPPARYADAGVVINVITKELQNGISGGVRLQHAFTTGFANDQAFLNIVNGNSQFAVSYSGNYRDYDDRFSDKNYDYIIDNQQFNYTNNMHDAFGYTVHNPRLKYTFAKPKNVTFQATFTPEISTRFNDGKSDVIYKKPTETILGRSVSESDVKSFGPSLDLYFEKFLPSDQELSLNVVGTYYHNKQSESESSLNIADNSAILVDNMNSKNDKKSLIGEIAYKKSWDNLEMSYGWRGTFAKSDYKISNILSDYSDYDYKSYNENEYFYGELSGSFTDDLSYRASLGATYVKNDNDDYSGSQWLFTPQLLLGWDFAESQALTLKLETKPQMPLVSQLSTNSELVIPYVLSQGNPNLKTANYYNVSLDYTLELDKWSFDFDVHYEHTQNAINKYYINRSFNGESYLFSIYENAKSFKEYGGYYYIDWTPFDDFGLDIEIEGWLVNQEIVSGIIGNHSHFQAPMYYTIGIDQGNWGVSYDGNIVSKSISGQYLSRDENQSHLTFFYQFNNNIRITAGCMWLFTKSKYEVESLERNLLYLDSHTYIDDNKSMFVLGFAWNFSKGKMLNVQKKLQNQDNDKGTF